MKPKTQHTPGPWTATINRYPDGLYQGRPYIYSSKHGYIAETFMNEDGEANARLIAAAPALLEALKLCQVRLFMLNGSENEEYQKASEAITLAQGKQNEP